MTKDVVSPRAVREDEVWLLSLSFSANLRPNPSHGQWIADSGTRKYSDRRSGLAQLRSKAPFVAQKERILTTRPRLLLPRECYEKRLDPPEDIPIREMKQPHGAGTELRLLEACASAARYASSVSSAMRS